MSYIYETLTESLQKNSIFTHTDTPSAEAFLETMGQGEVDKVTVAIVGDEDITDGRRVSRCINMVLRMFQSPDNVRLITGELTGIESIVRRYAKANNFELDVFPLAKAEGWKGEEENSRQLRDLSMLASCHCVVIITRARSTSCDFMYRNAVECGRFVTKRLIKDMGNGAKKT